MTEDKGGFVTMLWQTHLGTGKIQRHNCLLANLDAKVASDRPKCVNRERLVCDDSLDSFPMQIAVANN